MTETENQKNSKILIVDDLMSARKILCRFLNKAGFTNVIQASDGEEALAVLEKDKIDIVISDWHMPSMDGLELKMAMAERDTLTQIPFLLITSSNELEDVEEALEAGVSDYICKPFSLEVITGKISKYLSTDK